jgi:hypothetical protein
MPGFCREGLDCFLRTIVPLRLQLRDSATTELPSEKPAGFVRGTLPSRFRAFPFLRRRRGSLATGKRFFRTTGKDMLETIHQKIASIQGSATGGSPR